MKVLVTGCAGFIGWEVSKVLLEQGNEVIGVDNLNDYYDVKLKKWRLENLNRYRNFNFYRVDIEDISSLKEIFKKHKVNAVVNEAARAGVRYSLKNPWIYMRTNAYGTLNLLELMKEFEVPKFVLASTSSLYAGQPLPFKEDLPVNTPISPYAASKKSAEVIAYTYHHLYGIDVTVLRYFTVYGPAGRPDMSPFRFIYWTIKEEPILLFGDGTQSRDFTYIADIADGTIKALAKRVGYQIINLGNSKPYTLKYLINLIEKLTGKKARIVHRDFHKADMKDTWAHIEKAEELLNWKPSISLEEGMERTVRWFFDNWSWLKNIKV